ncbi:MAG TPA: hypothetical protein VFO07_06080 [Roseiflexaceae bacterium]|nr:hypothetical protein [Roseiflexaceae bacterium]
MLVVLGQITLIVVCALALCVYAGWGACALFLPRSLRPFGGLLVPLVGYALVIWLGYLGVSTILDLRWSLALVLIVATALDVIAWRRGARPQVATSFSQFSILNSQFLPLAALLIITFLVGVLPLLRYGYLTAIGQGWDTESYLPMAQHLIDYPLARIPEAPLNPLRDLVSDPPRIGVTLGFSVFQGMTMLLSRQSALATFAPLLALLRVLGVLAIYVWLRATMGLGRGAALLGAAGAAAGALLLWISYFNFGMQMAAWPLLALGLTVGLAVVDELARTTNDQRPPTTEDRGSTIEDGDVSAAAKRSSILDPRSSSNRWLFGVLLLTGVVLAALPVAYYPALTIWIPMAVALGMARLLEAFVAQPSGGRAVVRLLLAALAVGVVALILAAPTIRDYYAGFSFRYSLPAQHVGPDRFIAPTETIGLLAFRLPNDGPQPPAVLSLGAAVLVGLLAVAGLLLPTNDQRPTTTETESSFVRLRWLALVAAVVAYLAWLRFGRPYEYGYMKGSAYAGFVAWGLVALGWQALWARFRPSDQRPTGDKETRRQGDNGLQTEHTVRNTRQFSQFSVLGRVPSGWFLVLVLALAPLVVAVWAQALTVADHWDGPALFTRDIAAFDSAAARVPPGATVALSADAAFAGPISGQLAASLYGREIWGHLNTAYTNFDYWPEGRAPQYAVLAADERPWPLDMGGQELWRSGAAALYQLGGAPMLSGRSAFYSAAPPTDRGSPAALGIWRRGGAYREATPDAPLAISIGDTLGYGPGPAQGAARDQQLRLTVASLVPQNVVLSYGVQREQIALAPGVSRIGLPLATPATLTIAPAERLALIETVVADAPVDEPPRAHVQEDQLAWSAFAEQRGPTTNLRVEFANPARRALRIGLTVVEDTFEGPQRPLRLLAAAPLEGAWQLQIDLARGATQALVGTTPTPLLALDAQPSPPDGRYFGVLTLYDGEQPIADAPVFTLRVEGGTVADFEAVPFTVEATAFGKMAEPLPANEQALLHDTLALDDDAVALDGALLHRRPPWPGASRDAPWRPGDVLSVRLGWRGGGAPPPPLMVSLQVLGDDDHKYAQWDGPLGGDWRPIQSWSAGERVRQDVPLTLDPATPPGDYRLLLVVYDPATGQPRTFGGQAALSLGELMVR